MHRRYQAGSVPGGVLLFIVLSFAVLGWGRNLYKLIKGVGEESSAVTIVRIVGVTVAPLGAIMGYVPSDEDTSE